MSKKIIHFYKKCVVKCQNSTIFCVSLTFLLAATHFLQSCSVQSSVEQSIQNLKFEFHSKLDCIRIWSLLNLKFVKLDSIRIWTVFELCFYSRLYGMRWGKINTKFWSYISKIFGSKSSYGFTWSLCELTFDDCW